MRNIRIIEFVPTLSHNLSLVSSFYTKRKLRTLIKGKGGDGGMVGQGKGGKGRGGKGKWGKFERSRDAKMSMEDLVRVDDSWRVFFFGCGLAFLLILSANSAARILVSGRRAEMEFSSHPEAAAH